MECGEKTRVAAICLCLLSMDARTFGRLLPASNHVSDRVPPSFLGMQCSSGLTTTNTGASSVADCVVPPTDSTTLRRASNILKYPTETMESNDGVWAAFQRGGYEISASSYIGDASSTYLGGLFDGVLPSSVGGGTGRNKYLNNVGSIVGTTEYIVGDYYGEWIKVKMPTQIWLAHVKIYMRAAQPPRAPGDYRVYGSTDDDTWDLLIDTVGATYAEDPSFGTSKVHKSAEINPAKRYQLYAIVVNKIVGGIDSTMLNFEELEIYGSTEKCGECLAGQYCDWPRSGPSCVQVRGAHDPPPPTGGSAVQTMGWQIE